MTPKTIDARAVPLLSLRELLESQPDIQTVEAFVTDVNGAARGKWLPREKGLSLADKGVPMPAPASRSTSGEGMSKRPDSRSEPAIRMGYAGKLKGPHACCRGLLPPPRK